MKDILGEKESAQKISDAVSIASQVLQQATAAVSATVQIHSNDHDIIIRLDENIKEVLRRINESDGRSTRNEGRITALENFRWWILGVAATTSIAASYLKDIIRH